MSFGKLTLFSFAVILTLPFPGAGQNPSVPTAPTIHVYSRETIVDVLVTDDKGQPVRGLTRSDFTVEEDGKSQPIRSFYEIDKTTPPAPARILPPNTYTNSTALPANGPVQIFLFDRQVSAPADLQRSKPYIASYFRTMPAGTTVAIFVLSPSKGLSLLQGFTSDGSSAASAVESLDVEWLPEPSVGALHGAIAAANVIAAYAAGVKGRKNLIWILPGSPPAIVHDGGYSWGVLDMNLVHRLMDLYDLFTREQIAIYPLNPKGVHTIGPPTVGKMETLAEARGALYEAENPLLEVAVADGTGGAISNSNDYPSDIARIVDSTNHFYTLSYVPTRPDVDGHFHPIKVTVDRPGLHLNYRSGYNDEQPDPPSDALLHAMVQSPLRLGAIPATQVLFDLQVQPGSWTTEPSKTGVSSPAPPTPREPPTTPFSPSTPNKLHSPKHRMVPAPPTSNSISARSTSTARSSPPAARLSRSRSLLLSTTGSSKSR